MAEENAPIEEKVFEAYREATNLFKQGEYDQALAKFEKVIALGRYWPHDDMVSRSVHAALDQVEKCQFRLLRT